MSVTRATFHDDRSWLNNSASLNISAMSVTRATFHGDRSWLNDFASLNIPVMSVTRATFHDDKSRLNLSFSRNKDFIFVIWDTSQVATGPFGSFEQSPDRDISKHSLIASLSDFVSCGVNRRPAIQLYFVHGITCNQL